MIYSILTFISSIPLHIHYDYDHRLLMVELEIMFSIALICISPGHLKLNSKIFPVLVVDNDDDDDGITT